MEEIIEYVTNNQFAVAAVFLSVCLITYLLFGKFFKLALVVILLITGLCGYLFIKDPTTAKGRISNIWETVKEKTVKITASSNEAYTKGKGYIEKGKKAKEDEVQRIFDSPKGEQEKK